MIQILCNPIIQDHFGHIMWVLVYKKESDDDTNHPDTTTNSEKFESGWTNLFTPNYRYWF